MRQGKRKRDRRREKEREQSLLFPFFSSLFGAVSTVRSFTRLLACSLLLSRSFMHSSSECIFVPFPLRHENSPLPLFFLSLLLFCHAPRCICQWCIRFVAPIFCFVRLIFLSLFLFPSVLLLFYSTLYIDRVDFHQFHRQYIRTECLFMKRQCHIVARKDFTLLLTPAVA